MAIPVYRSLIGIGKMLAPVMVNLVFVFQTIMLSFSSEMQNH